VTAFFDTNILVYAIADDPRGDKARTLLEGGGAISVQVLNEFTRVARGKLRLDWGTVENALSAFREIFANVAPLTLAAHDKALELAKRDGLSIFDALIVAAAIEAGCDILYSEDLQDGRMFGALRIVNPLV
jgi:predicted nucleic acid-binding protein